MLVTNCSYTLVLALPEDLEPLSKSQCPFLGQPQSHVLVRPRSPQLAQSGGLRRKKGVMVGEAGQGMRQRPPVQDLLQEHTAAFAPSESPSHTSPHCPWLGPCRGILSSLHEQQVLFFLHLVQSFQCWYLCLDEMRLFSAFHCLALKSLLPSLHRAQ